MRPPVGHTGLRRMHLSAVRRPSPQQSQLSAHNLDHASNHGAWLRDDRLNLSKCDNGRSEPAARRSATAPSSGPLFQHRHSIHATQSIHSTPTHFHGTGIQNRSDHEPSNQNQESVGRTGSSGTAHERKRKLTGGGGGHCRGPGPACTVLNRVFVVICTALLHPALGCSFPRSSKAHGHSVLPARTGRLGGRRMGRGHASGQQRSEGETHQAERAALAKLDTAVLERGS